MLAGAGRVGRARLLHQVALPLRSSVTLGVRRYDVSTRAAATLRAPDALQDALELDRLVAAAGFQNVRVRPTIEMTRLPLPAEFVPGHLAALPIAQEIARLAADRRATIVEDMTKALRGYVDRDQITVPAGADVVTADA